MMRRMWVGGAAVFWFGLACSGAADPTGGPPEAAPPPAPPAGPPPGWDLERVPASRILTGRDRVCGRDGASVVWRTDGTFLAERPDAKFGGGYKLVDGDIVYLTAGPIGPEQRCTAARFLLSAAGEPEVLLCAEGPVGCTREARWAVEVVGVGVDRAATDAVAALVGATSAAFGGGVVFPGAASPLQARARGVSVRYRDTDGTARRLAEDLGPRLQAAVGAEVAVRADPEATSPVVVVVAPLDEAP